MTGYMGSQKVPYSTDIMRLCRFRLAIPGLFIGLFASVLTHAQSAGYASVGQVVRLDSRVNELIPANAKIEIIASGFAHLEGPVWVRDSNYLLVSDTKQRIIYKWSPTTGLATYLSSSGYTGRLPYSDEAGSNGLAIDQKGKLIICEHGDRRVAIMPIRGAGSKRTLTDSYQNKRYNSPNDVVVHPNGSYYFSDPPYGLPKKAADPMRETTISGVYRVAPAGAVSLEIKELASPNGLAFSGDGKLLYVSQSDSLKPLIRVYAVRPDGSIGPGRLFFDASSLPKEQPKDVTDGLKVDLAGNVWATGPGGVLVIASPKNDGEMGQLLGRISTGEVIANCAWGDDGSTLYLASGSFLCRIRTTAKGVF